MATANLWRETQGCHWCHGENIVFVCALTSSQTRNPFIKICLLPIFSCWLVVIPTPLKNMKVTGKVDIPYIMENKTCSKPPASLDWWPSTWIFIQTQPLFSTWTPSEHLSRPSAAAPGSVDQSIHGALGESDVQALQALGDIFPGRKRELDR